MTSETRKFAPVFKRSIGVCLPSIFLIVEIAQKHRFHTDRYLRLPPLFIFIPMHAFVTTSAARLLYLIRQILRVSAWPNILSRVTQTIVVSMIVLLAIWQSGSLCYDTVHSDCFLPLTSHGIPSVTMGCVVFDSTPMPLHEEVVVNGIDNSHFSLC